MSSFSRRGIIVSGSTGLSAIALLSGIGQSFSVRAQTPVRSTLRIGMANQVPYAYTSETGELIGQSPDVLRAALRDTPYKKLESVVTEFGALIPGLVASRFDIICTGLFIRPQRCDVISFGNVDSMSRTGIMVLKGSPRHLGGFDDVKNMGLRVAFIRGSTEERHVTAAGIPESLWVVLPDVPTVIAAIKGGRADVAVGSAVIFGPTLQKMNEPSVELRTDFAPPNVEGHPSVEYAAMGFRKSDSALREMYNAGLARLVVSGELASINEKWGLPRALTPTAELPPSEQLCKA